MLIFYFYHNLCNTASLWLAFFVSSQSLLKCCFKFRNIIELSKSSPAPKTFRFCCCTEYDQREGGSREGVIRTQILFKTLK